MRSGCDSKRNSVMTDNNTIKYGIHLEKVTNEFFCSTFHLLLVAANVVQANGIVKTVSKIERISKNVCKTCVVWSYKYQLRSVIGMNEIVVI